MKRRIIAVICACLMIVSLAACGENNTATSNEPVQTEAVSEADIAPAVEASAEAEPVEEVDVTPSEEKPEEEIEETEEIADAEASVQEEKEPVGSDADDEVEELVEEITTEPEAESTPENTQAPATDEQQPAQDTAAVDDRSELVGPIVDTIVPADGESVFDMEDYVYNVCDANDYYVIEHQVDITFGSWFVEISTDKYNSNLAYISMGRWDYNAFYWNINTYSYVFDFGESTTVTSCGVPECVVSRTAIEILPTLVNYMKASPRTDIAPNIPGCTFKPCQSDNPFVQY